MRVSLTGEELSGIAERLTQRLESTVKAAIRRSVVETPEPSPAGLLNHRELARELTPIVCPEDALLSAAQARALMGIRSSKWHMLRSEGKVPKPIRTICGDRWRRSTILACMAHVETGAEDAEARDEI